MERILLIEDDVPLADYVRRGLTYEGYEAHVSASAEAGLVVLRALQPRAVILDIMLPGMDGLTACRALRASGYAGPVLMLTARDGIGDRIAGLDSGADDYLPKPFEFDELLARLRALHRCCPGPNGTSILVAADIVLDEEQFVACRGQMSLALSHAEFVLLALLMRPPRAARTRDELLSGVWGNDFEGDDKVLDVTISRLRAKLGHPDPIRTLHSVGYILSETSNAPRDAATLLDVSA